MQHRLLAVPKTSTHLLRQIIVVTRIELSTLHLRLKGAAVIVVGVGVMVFVLLSILSIAEGAKLALLGSGDPGRAWVYATGGNVMHPLIEWRNVIFSDRNLLPAIAATLVDEAPGLARTADGIKLVDTQISLNLTGLIKRNNNDTGFTTLLGVGPRWQAMAPSFRLLSGRMPKPGARELIAGELARQKFSSLDKGAVDFADTRWRIVGTFENGDFMDGYLIGDAQTLKETINHPIDTVLLVRLTAPERFEAFRQGLQKRLPPNVRVERETDHYANVWKGKIKTSAVFDIAYLLAGLIGAGMVAGTMVTMRIAVEARAQEIAILRAIGFDGCGMATSVVLEAMALAVLGALIGTALVWLWLDGFLYNAGAVITVRVDMHLLLVGASWALTVALIGATAPALRLARQTPIEALREV